MKRIGRRPLIVAASIAGVVALGVLFAVLVEPSLPDPPRPTAPFVAEARSCSTTGAHKECAKLIFYFTPTMYRLDTESELDGPARITRIIDVEKRSSTELDPKQRRYRASVLDPGDELKMGFLLFPLFSQRIGEETLAGQPVAKYRMDYGALGFRLEGFAWVSRDNVVVRMETTTSFAGSSTVQTFDVTKLTLGAFDPNELAIPSGYKRLGED